jgi:hypothetical protein
MSFRPVIYWLACSALAVIAVGAAEPGLVNPDVFNLTNLDASSVKPVPEPSRALLLFAGIMAMAFTYRKAWLNWKRGGWVADFGEAFFIDARAGVASLRA